MEITLGYAIAIGSVLLVLILLNLFPCFPYLISFLPPFFHRALRNLKYRYFVYRHRFLSPWAPLDAGIQLLYIAGNFCCVILPLSGIAKAGLRAGNLSLINLILLFLGPHLGFLADILGVSLSTFRHIHRLASLMSLGLALFHILVIFGSHSAFALSDVKNISAVVGGSSLVFIVILSWPPLRRRFYEIFLRLRQIFAAVVAVSTLLHVPPTLFPRLYFYIAAGVFTSTSVAEGWLLLRNCRIFSFGRGEKAPKIKEVFRYPNGADHSPIQVKIYLHKSLELKAGQYVNVCIPSLGFWSSMQSHPFVVTSWTGKRQTKLELIIAPRGNWTQKLSSRTTPMSGQTGGLGRVLFSGPHGISVPVDKYEYVFMIATGYGIVAHLALLERLVQGTRSHEVRARRIYLAWEIEDIGLYKAVYPQLNWVLQEHRDNNTLAISLYSTQLVSTELGQRAEILPYSMPLKEVFNAEILEIEKRKRQEIDAVEEMEDKRNDEKERGRREIFLERPSKEIIYETGTLPVCTRTPGMLITVSASTKIRDELRRTLKSSLDISITLAELDYQPLD